METTKIRVKVGPHEFEAEGPKDIVSEQFQNWKEMIATASASPPQSPGAAPLINQGQTPSNPIGASGSTQPTDRTNFDRVFSSDEKSGILSLRVHPTTEDRDADSVLLLMLAYRTLKNEEEVAVTTILESLRVSGIQATRLDRTIAPHMRSGFLLRSGRGKGGKYRLSNTGLGQGQRLLAELVGKMA